jgi:hypothetical protein
MEAFKRICEIELEIIAAANNKAGLETIIKTSDSEAAKRLAASQKQLVELRIERAQAEIKAIEEANFAEVQSARRNAKYPPIPAPVKTVIEYAEA